MRIICAVIAIALIWLAGHVSAFAAPSMVRVGEFGDWTLLADGNDPHQFCFVTSEPKSIAPDNAERESPRAYVSAWPQDGIRAELSFRMGFRIKKGAQGKASVGQSGVRLFGSSDRAYVLDSIQELKLIDAMRKGSTMTVAIAGDGNTTVTDTYSLTGIGVALQKLQETCF